MPIVNFAPPPPPQRYAYDCNYMIQLRAPYRMLHFVYSLSLQREEKAESQNI
jgi:hypothetical protein